MLHISVVIARIILCLAGSTLSSVCRRIKVFERLNFTNEARVGTISASNSTNILCCRYDDFGDGGVIDCYRLERIDAGMTDFDSEEHTGHTQQR